MSKHRIPPELYKQILLNVKCTCVDVFVFKEGKILLGYRTKSPGINSWAPPGGWVWKEETPIDASNRHVGELGIKIKNHKLVDIITTTWINHPQNKNDLLIYYSAEYDSGHLISSEELQNVGWFDKNNLPKPIINHWLIMLNNALNNESSNKGEKKNVEFVYNESDVVRSW